MSLVFQRYFDLGGVMPGGKGKIGGSGPYGSGFKQLLYDGVSKGYITECK